MRVTFLATLPPQSSTIIGRTIPLANELQRHGHKAQIITLGEQQNEQSNVPIICAGPPFRDSFKKPNKIDLISRYFSGKKGLINALYAQKADVVVLVKPHPQNYAAIKKLNVPVVLDADDDEVYVSRLSFFEQKLMQNIENNSAKKAGLILCCSQFLVDKYSTNFPNKKVEFIPNGINKVTTEKNINLREKFSIAPDEQIMLYIGALAITSGHRVDLIFSAWKKISQENPKLHFVLAGDGVDEQKIRAQASSLPEANRIHFLGRFDNEMSQNLAAQANILIDPIDDSRANEAKSSSRALLGIVTRIPVVSGNIGIRKNIIPYKTQNWTLYNTQNINSMTDSIKYSLTKTAQEQFAKEAEEAWKQWTWEKIGAKFTSLLESLTT
jgi:glycosyltransferase involved in cell wall biosynthesis